MRIPQRVGRWLRAEQGSQGLEAAGAALAAALIVLALLAGARGVLGPAVERAFQCAAAALVGGGAGCGGATGETAPAQLADSSTPGESRSQQEQCGAWCQVGGVFKGSGEVLWETVKGIGTLAADGFKAATGDQATRDKYAAAWDAIRNDPGGALRAIWDGIADPIAEDWRAGRKGEAIGRALTEIVGTVAGPKGVDKLGKLGKLDDLARTTDRLSDTRRAVNHLPCVGAAPAGKGPGLAKLVAAESCGDATRLRNSPGQVRGDGNLSDVPAGQRWLQNSSGDGVEGRVPGQVARQLQGRTFNSFDDFREAFWKAAADDPVLQQQFSPQNLTRMRDGYAPFAPGSEHYGKIRNYVLHHETPIQHGGGVYDLDNIMVVSPKRHQNILPGDYHFGNGQE